MALARTWHSVVDIPLDDTSTADAVARSAALALKRCLMGDFTAGGTAGANGAPPIPWTLDYSSDSVTAGAGDKWASIASIVGAASATVARSWAAFSSPSGTRRFLLDVTATATGQARTMATKDAFAVGGLSTSQPPNANTWLAATSLPWEGAAQAWLSPTIGMHRAAFTMDAAGEHWMFIVYKPSLYPANVCVGALGIWPIRSRAEVAQFAHPWAFLLAPMESGRRLAGSAAVWTGLSVAPLALYLPGAAEASKAYVASNSSSGTDFSSGSDGVNGFTGRYDEIQCPVFAAEHATRKGFVGNLEDLGWTHINMQGTWTPQAGIERVTWGAMLIPFAVAPVL